MAEESNIQNPLLLRASHTPSPAARTSDEPMDALTLYVIVQLANGDLQTVDAIPLPINREPCSVVAKKFRYDGWSMNFYVTRKGAKSVMFYCAPWLKPLVIAR